MMTRTTMRGAVAAAALLAGPAFGAADDLTVFDWSGYEDPGFFGSYVEKHGGAPSYTFFGSQDEAFTKLQSGFQADLAHPCTDATRKWAAAGLIQPIDTDKIDNWDAILPAIRDVDGVTFDGETWMVPFDWGNTGLIYRTDEVNEDEISLQSLTDPANAGRIALPDGAPSAYAMAALATGAADDYTSMSDEQFQKASDFLREVHPNVRFYWSDPGQLDQALASGEVAMGWAWNQTELNLIWNDTPARMMRGEDKGIATWVCGYVHLKDATASDAQVYDMLNALTDTRSGKYIIESWGYGHANGEAFEAADPELVETYGFSDAEDFFEGTLFFDAVDPELESRMLQEYERIKAGF